MLSKAKIKFVKSLQLKKYRKQEQCFVVEGVRSVQELMASDFEVVLLLATNEFLANNRLPKSAEVIEVTDKELSGIGEFQSNDSVLAVAKMQSIEQLDVEPNEFALVLDDIRDPGNLGTIIRTADWFGITKIIASEETADVYNPKVIASTMGSFTRCKILYTDLATYLERKKGVRMFGAFLDGKDVHTVDFGRGGLVVIGNESRGISSGLAGFITDKITIPKYGKAESLNAAMAAAIVCDNLRRG
ncbi:MAG TPA: RNA methyltransferase [Chryseolinea sp.]|nr:RNA methyltransferase [Chryseolinea sp.]